MMITALSKYLKVTETTAEDILKQQWFSLHPNIWLSKMNLIFFKHILINFFIYSNEYIWEISEIDRIYGHFRILKRWKVSFLKTIKSCKRLLKIKRNSSLRTRLLVKSGNNSTMPMNSCCKRKFNRPKKDLKNKNHELLNKEPKSSVIWPKCSKRTSNKSPNV